MFPNAQYPLSFQLNITTGDLGEPNFFNIGSLPENDELIMEGGVLTTTTSVQGDGTASCIAAGSLSDQWVQIKLNRLTANGAVFVYLKGPETTETPCYRLSIQGPFGLGGNFTVDQVSSDGGSIVHTWILNQAFNFEAGMLVAFTLSNNNLGVWINGTLVWEGNVSASPEPISIPGFPGLQLASESDPPTAADVAISEWQIGKSTR